MLHLSPLQLKNHFFTVFSVRANPNGTPTAETSLEPSIFFQKLDEKGSEWQLGLRVLFNSAKRESPFIYTVEAEIQGIVVIHDQYQANNREMLAAVNGLGILYGAIREMVLNTTSRSGYGPMCLPALNFLEIVSNRLQQQQKTIEFSSPKDEAESPKS